MRLRVLNLTSAAIAVLATLKAISASAQTSPSRVLAASGKPLLAQHRALRPWHRALRPWHRALRPWHRALRPWSADGTPSVIANDPFRGNLGDFWGTLNTTGAKSPLDYPAIGAFWEANDTRWDSIAARWDLAQAGPATREAYAPLASDLQAMVRTTAAFWGATYTAQTGRAFDTYANEFLGRYGVRLDDPLSLAAIDPGRQTQMFVEWYDDLMRYSGRNNVDYWMSAVNWTPRLTQTQTTGTRTTIGVVDFFFSANDSEIASKVIYSGGNTLLRSNHGAAVASLILGAHDGRGVMGIAPKAMVAAYNPFDAAGTAGWSDVVKGIVEVTRERGAAKDRASVVNLSLGEPGWTFARGWRDVFKTSAVDTVKDHTIYVIAAGNDGVSQTANVEMNGALDSTFIVVGSVDLSGTISDFSNRPGTACLTDGGVCKKGTLLKESGNLMNRFIVAPGEFLLASDGAGGVARQSGTSLAAPLVSGAIALIHDRWPWLKAYPRDVAQAILGSARDLGAPGVDPVYGVGMLDVEAAQSPLNFGALKYYLVGSAGSREVSASTLMNDANLATWEAQGVYFSAFETLTENQRDFLIPLSTRLIGTRAGGRTFQDYLYDRFTTWASGGSGFASTPGVGLTDVSTHGQALDGAGWSFAMRGRLVGGYGTTEGYRPVALRSSIEVRSPENRFAFAFGQGDGALHIGGAQGFGMTSDFDPAVGGANPLLGFASGGAHASASAKLAPGVSVTAGVTLRDNAAPDRRSLRTALPDTLSARLSSEEATGAQTIRLDYTPHSAIDLAIAYTRLREGGALLGVRSLEPTDLGRATTTEGVTFNARARIGEGISLFGTGTIARSTTPGGAALAASSGGITSKSYQLGIAKDGIVGSRDTLRLSLAAPLRVTRGTLDFQSVAVVDRQTGATGIVTQTIDLAPTTRRRLVAEGHYALPIMGGAGDVALFGRGELRNADVRTPDLMLGAQARLAF